MVKTLVPALALACATLTFAPHQASAAPFGAASGLSTAPQDLLQTVQYYGGYGYYRPYYRPRYHYHRPRYYYRPRYGYY